MSSPSAKTIFTNPINFLAFGFGSGLSPIMPGTFGTLVAIPFYLLFAQFSWLTYFIILILTTIFGIWICDQASKNLGEHDYPGIVFDEMVGYWLTMLACPFDWKWILLGFLYFRLFDIVKPWPIRVIDKQVKGGLGIMLDDILAAVFAAVVLWLTRLINP
jgi:phosphatidylglycerophosphatase A